MALGLRRRRGLPRHRHLTRAPGAARRPRAAPDALVGAIQYYDAQVDDARHTMTSPHRRGAYGALCQPGRVVGFLREGERVTGARVRDLETGEEFEVRARRSINATGVWTDDTQAWSASAASSTCGLQGRPPRRAARPDPLDHRADPAHREERAVRHPVGPALDRRHHRHRLGPRQGAPGGQPPDIDYLLEHVNAVLATPLTREDVEGVYAGLRPLLAGESERPDLEAVPRARRRPPGARPGRVAGGKYTTYRVMAKDAVDAAPRPRPAGCPSRHRRRAAGRRRGLPGAVEPAASGSPPSRGCTSRGSSTCSAATAR
jgi:glycerol-3-phosphate dehydrogenase